MITMQSAWHARESEQKLGSLDRQPAGNEEGSVAQYRSQQFLLGELMERSISAPPPTGAFGGEDGNGFLFGMRQNGGEPSSGSQQLGRSSDDFLVGGLTSTSGAFLDRQTASARGERSTGDAARGVTSSTSALAESLLSNLGQATAMSSSSSSPSLTKLGSDRLDYGLGSQSTLAVSDLGRTLARPQSAAPEFASAGSTGHRPPPGLEESSASSGGGMRSSTSGGSILFDTAAGKDDIMQAGMRRPASTGVIGQGNPLPSSSVMESLGLTTSQSMGSIRAVGPSSRVGHKTTMDLIQEDFPKTPSPKYYDEDVGLPTPSQRESQQVKTASPIRSEPVSAALPYKYPEDNVENLSRSMQNMNVGSQASQVDSSSMNQHFDGRPGSQYLGAPTAPPHHQVPGIASGMQAMSQQNYQQGMYHVAPSGHHMAMQHLHGPTHPGAHSPHHAMQHQMHQQSPYEAQTIYYSTQQERGSAGMDGPVQSHVLHTTPTGQPVYVNAPPYGYTTVQYHPIQPTHHHHHPNVAPRHVVLPPHHHHPGSGHPQEYISVVPIHPSHQIAGTYAYVQQPGSVNAATSVAGASTLTVMNAHVPVTTATIAVSGAGSPNSSGGKSGRGGGGKSSSERGSGRNRRGGGTSGGRRGGTASDHQSHSKHLSPTNSAASGGLLDEFRTSKNRSWTMHDIKGHVVEFCQDQNGSRFIQQRLEVADPAEKQVVIAEVLPSVRRLRNDVFGNYVVQKLLSYGTPQMKIDLRDTMKGDMLPLSLQMYGCRVVQKAFETLHDDDLPGLLTELHQNVLSCIHDQNGNHVIQKCIEVMSIKAKEAKSRGDDAAANFASGQIQFVLNDVLDNVESLSCHPYGCRVLQRILEHCVDFQKTRALDEIGLCHRALLDDQYGNYVIQHVLQYGRNEDRDSILNIIVNNDLLTLSRQKFASNVVEKLLKFGSPEQRNAIVREMLKVVNDSGNGEDRGSSVALLMVRDAYANYVVQTTLDVLAEGEERRLLLEELRSNENQLRNYTFAKHIVAKLTNSK